jgi:hypothetical protein
MQFCQNSASRLACTLALCIVLMPAGAFAAPVDGQTRSTGEQNVAVSITQPEPSIDADGELRVDVEVSLTAPAEYVEVRLRLRQPSGRLVYQKTEIRSNLGPGEHVIAYEHDLAAMNLRQGRYPIEVRVLATGSQATNASSRLLVLDKDADSLPVAIVVLATGEPGIATNGRFAGDLALDAHLRDELSMLTRIAGDRRAPVSLALPPVLLEQFARVAAGVETSAGVVVEPTSDTAVRTGRMLDDLRSALETGTVDLIDVPFALPDVGRLAAMNAIADLRLHWSRTDATNATVLHSVAEPKIAYLGEALTPEAVASVEDRGLQCVLAPPSAVESAEGTVAPGCYQLDGRRAQILVSDDNAAAATRQGAEPFYDALFGRLNEGGPIVLMLEIGSDDAEGIAAFQHALDWIDEASWLRLASLESLAEPESGHRTRLADPVGLRPGNDYWAAIAEARASGLAFAAAAGEEDPDASAILRAVLVSESSLYPEAPLMEDESLDGRDLARECLEYVTAQFSLLRIDAKDVTLSGTKGEVPFTLVNGTGKTLDLTIRARPSAVLPDIPTQDVVIGPTQNLLTVPIDLGNVLSDTLRVEVLAGDMTVAEATVAVRASYIDRLAIIAMVVIVLGGLLVFIRRRVLSADAATIVHDDGAPREPRSGNEG